MKKNANWKIICAFLFDYVIILGIFWTVISYIAGGFTVETGEVTTYHARLDWPDVGTLILAMVIYVKLTNAYMGGTFGKKIFGIAKRPDKTDGEVK